MAFWDASEVAFWEKSAGRNARHHFQRTKARNEERRERVAASKLAAKKGDGVREPRRKLVEIMPRKFQAHPGTRERAHAAALMQAQ